MQLLRILEKLVGSDISLYESFLSYNNYYRASDFMINVINYKSPIGDLLLASKEEKLVGLLIEGQKYYLANIDEEIVDSESKILVRARRWLDDYFNGKKPDIGNLDLAPGGSEFRQEVWNILSEIPYGKTVTYKDIAEKIAEKRGIAKMSAQAVGGAVGHNPISIIIPCHRVVGSNGNLTGYAGGIDKKIFLLRHENVSMDNLLIPKF